MTLPQHLEYLKVYDYGKKLRLGNGFDGGYVISHFDDGYDCYISAGVSDEESFSRDFINLYKMNKTNSYAFDGTINNYPINYTRNITFVKKNIATYSSKKTGNLSKLIDRYNNIFLKMDIEGHEYPWLSSLTNEQLQKFKQITLEFHGINDDSWGTTFNDKVECFKKLSETHYLIHIHANNYDTTTNVGGKNIPNVIEVTYINKALVSEELSPNKMPMPCRLDKPNCTSRPDINLCFEPFVN
jgi:hypothetical protein